MEKKTSSQAHRLLFSGTKILLFWRISSPFFLRFLFKVLHFRPRKDIYPVKILLRSTLCISATSVGANFMSDLANFIMLQKSFLPFIKGMKFRFATSLNIGSIFGWEMTVKVISGFFLAYSLTRGEAIAISPSAEILKIKIFLSLDDPIMHISLLYLAYSIGLSDGSLYIFICL